MKATARMYILVGVLAGLFTRTGSLLAQTNIFGVQDRADAAERMIVLAVQQAIASLPPTSSQSFAYEYDPKKDTYLRSERLGPTVLRSPQTIGVGHFTFRLAASYFDVDQSLRPISYNVSGLETKFGLDATAQVTLVNLAASYGLTNHLEIDASVPLVTTRTRASEVFVSCGARCEDPRLGDVPIATDATSLEMGLQHGDLVLRRRPFVQVGADFPEGTHSGVGRMSIGGKALLYSSQRFRLAVAPEFFFPSPNEGQLAGSGSAAILPRAVAAFTVADPIKMYADAGYDYDFNHDELRRFVWTTGLSVSLARISVDAGLGGSRFNQGIKWTPTTASFPGGMITATEPNQFGTTFVDFLFGLKLRIAERAVLTGAVNVPVNDEGFRAAAVGTVALELYL